MFSAHGLSVDDHIAYLSTQKLPPTKCVPKDFSASNPVDDPKALQIRATVASAGLAADRTNLSAAIVEALHSSVAALPSNDPRIKHLESSSLRLIRSVALTRDTAELFELASSSDASVINLGLYSTGLRLNPTHIASRPIEQRDATQRQLDRVLTILASDQASSSVWTAVDAITGVTRITPAEALVGVAHSGAGRAVSTALTAISTSSDPTGEMKRILQSEASSAIMDSMASIRDASRLLKVPDTPAIFLDGMTAGDARGGVQALAALAQALGNRELSEIATHAAAAVQIATAIQDLAQVGMLTGGLGSLTMMSTGGAAALPGLLAGASNDEGAATRQSLEEIKNLLINQFAIVNGKLDKVLDVLTDNTKTLDELKQQLDSIGVKVERIDARLNQLAVQLAQLGQQLGNLIKEGDVAGCRGQISANNFTSYNDCVGQIIEYVAASYNPVLAQCPPSETDPVVALSSYYSTLSTADIWGVGPLGCYLNRSVEKIARLDALDIQLPNFALLISGVDMLRSMKIQQPNEWKKIGSGSQGRIRVIRAPRARMTCYTYP